MWAGNSGTQPAAGNGTCGSGTLSNSLSGATYNDTYVSTHLGQLWQGPLNGGSTQEQYLYCSSSQPHQLTGLYGTSATCSNKTGQGYASSYDVFGNVTSRTFSGTTATLSYDNFNHLTEWNAGSTNQEWYVYDAAGNRVLRRFTNSNGTTMIVYAFGLEEHTYSGAGAHQNDTYYYSLAGHLLGALDSNGTTFYLTDGLGSVLASFSNVANSAAVKGNQVFGPYGHARYYAGTINTAKGFTGQYNDGLTGLDYFNARYYDPVAGVFLSADTANGNLAGMNPYAYVNGNPETWSDPSGLLACNESGSICQVPPVPSTGNAVQLFKNVWGSTSSLQPFNPPSGGTAPTLAPLNPFAIHHTVGTTRPSNGFQVDSLNTCAQAGLSQALCGNGYANYAVYLSTGGEIGVPGPFSLCSECGPGGGPNDNGESGGFRDLINVLASDTGEDTSPQTLYHYTNEEGLVGILLSDTLNPSLEEPNIVYGKGQYLTDIAPEQIIGRVKADLTQAELDQGFISFSQLVRRLYGRPWAPGRFTVYLKIDVTGLSVENPASHVFLIPGIEPLDVSGRIIRAGATPFSF